MLCTHPYRTALFWLRRLHPATADAAMSPVAQTADRRDRAPAAATTATSRQPPAALATVGGGRRHWLVGCWVGQPEGDPGWCCGGRAGVAQGGLLAVPPASTGPGACNSAAAVQWPRPTPGPRRAAGVMDALAAVRGRCASNWGWRGGRCWVVDH